MLTSRQPQVCMCQIPRWALRGSHTPKQKQRRCVDINLPIRSQLDKHFSWCRSSAFPLCEHANIRKTPQQAELSSHLPVTLSVFHIHVVLNHQEARASLFTSSLTSVVLSHTDSLIHHQLSAQEAKARLPLTHLGAGLGCKCYQKFGNANVDIC